MKILLTNDDGIYSPSLRALFDRLSQEHDVWIVAPHRERSGSSHAITLNKPIRVDKKDERVFACEGTPVDCVVLVSLGLVEVTVDMVISGPNFGANLGTDIIYSGTSAAARQAALMGIPAVAASLYENGSDISNSLEFLARNLAVFRSLASSDHFLNINFPGKTHGFPGAAITFPSVRIYRDRLEEVDNEAGERFFMIGGEPPSSVLEPGSDYEAVANGMISLSPVSIHPTNHRIEERYHEASLWTGG
jgi:5'-nucleotidase